MAKVTRHRSCVLTRRLLAAGGEGVPDVSLGAAADGVVPHHVAPRLDAAHSHARVGALQVDARQARRTLAVDYTLGPAVGGSSEISWRNYFQYLNLSLSQNQFRVNYCLPFNFYNF